MGNVDLEIILFMIVVDRLWGYDDGERGPGNLTAALPANTWRANPR